MGRQAVERLHRAQVGDDDDDDDDDDGTKRKTNTEAHLEWGTHEPFEVIAGKESGVGITETGAMAALNTVLACQKLGYPWVQWNSFTKRAEYLYCKSGFKNKFETAWTEYQGQKGVQDDLATSFLAEGGRAAARGREGSRTPAASGRTLLLRVRYGGSPPNYFG